MYRGFTAAFIREMSYSTLRFGLYEPLRDLMYDNPTDNAKLLGEEWGGTVRVLKRMVSGCTAGGIASVGRSRPLSSSSSSTATRTSQSPPLARLRGHLSSRPVIFRYLLLPRLLQPPIHHP